jgi:hypothetical protein
MADTPESEAAPRPEDLDEPPPPPPAVQPRKSRRKWLLLPLSLVLIPIVIFALWTWVTLGYVYAEGDRAGFMQKLSRKGWLCKTWEGELAMVNLPGSVTPQIFHFTVRNDSIAHILQQHLGKQVSITYEEHRGIPTSCFGETSYFVTNVRTVGR